MKKFILKAAIFSALILATIFGVIYIPTVEKEKYIMELIDKHGILATTKQPRIILAGDSSLAYGMDSDMIRKATGYNVVNMGLHIGLGLIYVMEELSPYLKKDDVVIFIPIYPAYMGNGTGDNTLVEVTIIMPRIIKYYPRENIIAYIKNIPLTFQRRLRGIFFPTREGVGHRRSGFNEYGDNIGHIGHSSDNFIGKDFFARYNPQMVNHSLIDLIPEQVNDTLVQYMNRYSSYWRSRGVRLYIAYPPIMENNRPKMEEVLRKFDKDIRTRIQMKAIGSPLSYIYPRKYFYDNEFHLNGEGRKVYTRQFVEDLKSDPVLSRAPGR